MSVKRYDVGRLDAPVRTPQGFLRVPASIARTGVQAYQNADGSRRLEYRPPEEVFKADALASFELATLTLEHPPEPVTKDNVAKYEVGTLGETIRADGQMVSGIVLIKRADAIAAVDKGMRELSCGYECDLEMAPGTAPDGTRYDAIQRNIRGNHVAIVSRGRAGTEVRLKLDATDAVQVDLPADHTKDGGRKMALQIVRIDGYEFNVEEQVAHAIVKTQKAYADQVTQLTTERDTKAKESEGHKARADMADQAKTKAETALKEAQDPAKIKAAVAARVDLEQKARKVLGAEAKLDGKSDAEIKREVLTKTSPALKLDGKSDEYVAAAFDVAVQDAKGKDGDRKEPVIDRENDRKDALDEAQLREKMKEEHRDAYKGEQKK